MGVLIKIENALFDEQNVIGTIDIPIDPVYLTEYPVQDATLKGLYDLGGTIEESTVNHAPNATNETTVYGEPNVLEDCVSFPESAANDCRIATALTSTLANKVALIAMFKVNGTQTYTNRVLIGNRRGGTTATSFGLSLLNDCVRFGDGSGAIVAKSYAEPINSATNYAIVALVADTTGVRAFRYTGGALVELVNYEGTVDAWGTNVFQFGGDATSNAYGRTEISLAAIHEGEITDTQLEEICAFANAYGRYKGLTIE